MKLEDKQEHLRLLAIAYYQALEFLEPYNVGSPMLDCKRPFGCSFIETDILEIINAEPEEIEEPGIGHGDGNMVWSSEQLRYARKLYTEDLTPYLKEHGMKYFKQLNFKEPQT
jgi:hypothetical protein